MDSFTVLIIVGLIHCALFFFDTLFKSCSHYPYLYFLHNTGLQVEVFRLRWFTTVFNRFIQKCGCWRPRLLDYWFTLGARCSLILLPVAVYIFIKTALGAWEKSSGSGDVKSSITLEPMIPGVNLPIGDIGYYIATLIICSVVHEFGHAVAAVREDVHISGIGVIILFILPVVYVHINTEQYDSLHPKRQLLIICAGVWHNIVLALIGICMLTLLPILVYPFFDIGSGVAICNIQQASPVLGPTGLRVGDKIVALNQCQVKDYDTWYYCIVSTIQHQGPGYCVSSELVREHDESVSVKQLPGGVVECCSANSPDHLCFEYIETEGDMPELQQHSCLPGRTVIESTEEMCTTSSDCSVDLHCLKPSLDNHTRLLRIKRENEKIVIFLGHPGEIYHTVQVSDFVPYLFIPSAVPEVIAQLCKYVSVFSAGLAVINIIPCFYFDGQYIIQAVSNIILASKVEHKSVRNAIALCITICGTVFVFGNVLSVMLSSFL
ncbi:membrane-bound transcription factor site-2 protease [Periplaneta americana]|uniref:membrane-bound transcription factor site-2 protease n=1 Tax=Periplaneta americana TaxID=6978 RepID=UPI0037E99935